MFWDILTDDICSDICIPVPLGLPNDKCNVTSPNNHTFKRKEYTAMQFRRCCFLLGATGGGDDSDSVQILPHLVWVHRSQQHPNSHQKRSHCNAVSCQLHQGLILLKTQSCSPVKRVVLLTFYTVAQSWKARLRFRHAAFSVVTVWVVEVL